MIFGWVPARYLPGSAVTCAGTLQGALLGQFGHVQLPGAVFENGHYKARAEINLLRRYAV